jgi:hypothetical protein
MQDAFVANVAAVLGIDPKRIKVATVVPGRRLAAATAAAGALRRLMQAGSANAQVRSVACSKAC